MSKVGTFLVVQCLRACISAAGVLGSIPSQEDPARRNLQPRRKDKKY